MDVLPKLALKPGSLIPSGKGPVALYAGIIVKPKVSQKAPKVPKTTKGNVLPMIHCDELESGGLPVTNELPITHLAD